MSDTSSRRLAPQGSFSASSVSVFSSTLLFALVALLASPSAFAASGSWVVSPTNGNWEASGGDNNWSTGANTFPGTTTIASPPASTDNATFSVVSSTSAVTLAADLNISGITFGVAATALSAFTIGTVGGPNLVLTSGGTIQYLADTSAAATQTINAPIVFGGGSTAVTYTISNANALATNSLIFGGTLSGGTTSTTALTLTGANTGNNTISGLISNGSSSALSINKLLAGTWVLGNASNSFTGGVTIGAGTVSVASIGNSTFSSALGTNGTIKIGSGTTTAGTLLYTGSGEISDKVINLAATTTGGATIDQSGTSGLLKFTSDMTNSGTIKTVTLQGSNGGTGEFAGKIVDGTGATSVTKDGSNTWTLSGANAYTGLTTAKLGTLITTGTNSSAGAITITVGTLQLDNASNGGIASGLLTLGGAGPLQSLLPNQVLSNAVSVTSSGAFISGANSITLNGVTTFASSATRQLSSSITGGNTLTLKGDVFLGATSTGGFTPTLAGNGTTTINGNIGDYSGGTASGGGNGLTITNTGTTTLNGTNTYTGTTTMNAAAGTLVISGTNSSAGATTLTTGILQLDNATNGGLASGTLTLTAGTIQSLLANQVLSNTVSMGSITASGSNGITLNGTTTFTSTGRTLTSNITGGNSLTLQGNVFLGANSTGGFTQTLAGAGNTTINGNIGDWSGGTTTPGNALTFSNTGTTTLNGTNTFTGGTTITAGTVKMSSIAALGAAGSSISISNGATLQYASDSAINAYNITVPAVGGGIHNIVVGRATSGPAVDQSITSIIFPGASTNGGDTLNATVGGNVTSGTPTLTIGSVIGVNRGCFAHFSGNVTYSIGSMTGNSTATAGSATFMLEGTSASNQVTGVISDNTAGTAINSGAVTVNATGSGVWTFSNNNTYSGVTTINGGTLAITAANNIGNSSATNTIKMGAGTLAVTGTVDLGTARAIALTTGLTSNITEDGGLLTIGGVISTASPTATLNLNTTNSGVILLSGTNTTTAQVNVGDGSNSTLVRLGNKDALSSSSAVTVKTNSAVDLNGQGLMTGATFILNGTGISNGGVLYNTAGGNVTITGTTTVGSNSTIMNSGGLLKFSGNLTLGTNNTLTVGGSGDTTLGNGSNTNVTETAGGKVVMAGTGTLLFAGGNNTFSGGLFVLSGTVSGQSSATAFGNGTITLGNNSGTNANATLNLVSAFTYANPIVLATNNSGTLTISGTNSSAATYSGGVTGANNLTINVGGAISFTTAAVNNSGTVTNAGTAAVTIDTIGSLVTGVTQNGSGNLTVTTLNVNSAGTTLTANSNTKLTVANQVTGSGNLTLNNNGTLASGITLTGGANNTGTIINSSSNTGNVTITGVIGTLVQGVTQNSANSTLNLNGANTYISNTTVTSGTLVLAATTGQLAFKIGSDGVNNSIVGNGTLTLNGQFNFDLTSAAATGSWNIVNSTLTTTYSPTTFAVVGFTNSGGNWSYTVGGSTYTFAQTTGLLTAVPEPQTWALLAFSLTTVMVLRRRRNS